MQKQKHPLLSDLQREHGNYGNQVGGSEHDVGHSDVSSINDRARIINFLGPRKPQNHYLEQFQSFPGSISPDPPIESYGSTAAPHNLTTQICVHGFGPVKTNIIYMCLNMLISTGGVGPAPLIPVVHLEERGHSQTSKHHS